VDSATEAFLAHRNLLFTVAYEMLGSAADAEDVLQETWLRWAGVDLGTVRDQRAYLVRITTRQALGRLRTLGRRKESYVRPWLPEPLLTAPDVAEDVELADSVSMAMLLVLETLTPAERAVFVLREVFDVAYDEIAAAVGKSPAAVRQIAHWARPTSRRVGRTGSFHGRDPSRARSVPAGGRNRRPAEPARPPRAGRRPLG
jgi:RNA polymerase sigma factor (sigma-70 family)